MTKAERTRIGFPENFRHSAIFGKVRGQRGQMLYGLRLAKITVASLFVLSRLTCSSLGKVAGKKSGKSVVFCQVWGLKKGQNGLKWVKNDQKT